MTINIGFPVRTAIVLALAASNVTVDGWLWLRLGGDSSAPGRTKHLAALLATSFASITYLIASLAWLLHSFNSRAPFGRVSMLAGMIAAILGFVGGLALSNEPNRRIGICISVSALVAGFLWLLAIAASAVV